MAVSTELITLNSTKLGEKSLVLHCLSPDFGRRSFIVSAGRNMALYQPFSILSAEVVENPRSELWRLRGVSAAYSLNGLRSNVYKTTISVFMTEVVYRTVKDGAIEDGLYEWLRGAILTLDALEKDYSNYHLLFLLEFAGALGFAPSIEDMMPFVGDRLQQVSALLSADFKSFMLIPLTGSDRSDLAEIFLQYLRYHTDSAINVRSLAVLREIFR